MKTTFTDEEIGKALEIYLTNDEEDYLEELKKFKALPFWTKVKKTFRFPELLNISLSYKSFKFVLLGVGFSIYLGRFSGAVIFTPVGNFYISDYGLYWNWKSTEEIDY